MSVYRRAGIGRALLHVLATIRQRHETLPGSDSACASLTTQSDGYGCLRRSSRDPRRTMMTTRLCVPAAIATASNGSQ